MRSPVGYIVPVGPNSCYNCHVSIEDFNKKIKGLSQAGIANIKAKQVNFWQSVWLDDIFIFAIVVMISLLGFVLGRLSAFEGSNVPLEVQKFVCPVSLSASTSVTNISTPTQKSSQGLLVASKNGTKYYFPWCTGVSRISETNKVWFNSYEEAQKAGLTPASGCKGLK